MKNKHEFYQLLTKQLATPTIFLTSSYHPTIPRSRTFAPLLKLNPRCHHLVMKPRPTPLAKGKPISGTHLDGNLVGDGEMELEVVRGELMVRYNSQTFCSALFGV